MSKQEVKVASRIRTKKKSWYRILAPQQFGQKEIGESYLTAPETAIGRLVRANLKDLTGNVKDQNVYLVFRIEQPEGQTLKTAVVGYEVIPSYIKRLVRLNANRLDDCFLAKTKEGHTVIVKTFAITSFKTKRTIHAKLRKQAQEFFREEIGKVDFTAFVIDLVDNKVRAALKKKLDKVYPLREITVRVLSLQGKEAAVVPEADAVVAEALPEVIVVEDIPTAAEAVQEAPEEVAAV